MKIGDTVHTERKEAGSAILAECKAMTSPEPVPLGVYRGFPMELAFDKQSREYIVIFKGAITLTVSLGSDIHGNITRMDNSLDGMPGRLEGCKEHLSAVKTQLENAKAEIEKPFPQETELTEKSARLNEINIALNLDERDHELVDAAPDEGDSVGQPQRKERERDDER